MTIETHQLLFELSHPVRYDILLLLNEQPLRLTKIGEEVDANNPEVSRHLDRLKNAGLIKKDPNGFYTITHLGELIITSLSSLSFIASHDSFLDAHDLGTIPASFINRIYELAEGERGEGMMFNIQKIEGLFEKARKRLFVINNEMDRPPTKEEIAYLESLGNDGFEMRYLIEESLIMKGAMNEALKVYFSIPGFSIRVLPKIPLSCHIADDEALVSFLDKDGNIDFSVFFHSKDERFMQWCEDLFEYYWVRGSQLSEYSDILK